MEIGIGIALVILLAIWGFSNYAKDDIDKDDNINDFEL